MLSIQIKDLTSEEITGKMRMQFWRDNLESIYLQRTVLNPIAKSLSFVSQ